MLDSYAASPRERTTITAMSNKQRFYPNRTGEQMNWLRHFAGRLPDYTTTIDLEAGPVALAVQDALWVAYVVGEWQSAARTFAKAATQYAKDTEEGVGTSALTAFTPPPLPEGVVARPYGALGRVFKLVRIIKLSRGYTEAIGTDLGITITPGQAEHPAPDLKVSVKAGLEGPEVEVRFIKWGHFAICLECRRGGGDWEHVGILTRSGSRDARLPLVSGQAEVREYRARYWDKGSPNGEWSPVALVTVGV